MSWRSQPGKIFWCERDLSYKNMSSCFCYREEGFETKNMKNRWYGCHARQKPSLNHRKFGSTELPCTRYTEDGGFRASSGSFGGATNGTAWHSWHGEPPGGHGQQWWPGNPCCSSMAAHISWKNHPATANCPLPCWITGGGMETAICIISSKPQKDRSN